MYVPKQYREDRPDVLAGAIAAIRLTALVTARPDGLQVSHLPMMLKTGTDGAWTLEGHLARPNPHWTLAAPSVAIFQGPHAYISPSWYASKREHGRVVPTWNYIAVHAHGILEAVEDETWLRAHLDAMTQAIEAGRAEPWAVSDAPESYMAGMRRAIVGVRLRVSRVEGAWKMIQHRSDADRLGTISGLAAVPEGQAVAAAMRDLETARHP